MSFSDCFRFFRCWYCGSSGVLNSGVTRWLCWLTSLRALENLQHRVILLVAQVQTAVPPGSNLLGAAVLLQLVILVLVRFFCILRPLTSIFAVLISLLVLLPLLPPGFAAATPLCQERSPICPMTDIFASCCSDASSGSGSELTLALAVVILHCCHHSPRRVLAVLGQLLDRDRLVFSCCKTAWSASRAFT